MVIGIIISAAAGIVAAGAGYWYYRKRKAEYGSRAERRAVKRAGFGFILKKLQDIFRESKAEELKEEEVAETEKEEKKEKKGEQDKPRAKEAEAAEKGAKAAEKEAEAEAATDAIEERMVGMTAELQNLMTSIKNYAARKINREGVEESETLKLEDMTKDLKKTLNFNKMDERARAFIQPFVESLIKYLDALVNDEKEKETYHIDILINLKEAVNVMRSSIKGARIELRKLKKAERKERKDFKKEIRSIKKSIRAKKKILKKAMKSGKDADPELTEKLDKEIKLNEKELKNAAALQKQLRITYRTMDKIIRQMKRMLREVIRSEKLQKKCESSMKNREKGIKKRYNALVKHLKNAEKGLEMFEAGKGFHEISLRISGLLNIYANEHISISEKDLEFDELLKGFAARDIIIAQQMQASQNLILSLTNTEKAVQQGMAAMTSIMAAILDNSASNVNLEELQETLSRARKVIKYDEEVEVYMRRIAGHIEMASRDVRNIVDRMIEKDKKLIEEIVQLKKDKSKYIGEAMGSVVNRKVDVDKEYMSQAKDFAEQLGRNNAVAAEAYRKARRSKRAARAA